MGPEVTGSVSTPEFYLEIQFCLLIWFYNCFIGIFTLCVVHPFQVYSSGVLGMFMDAGLQPAEQSRHSGKNPMPFSSQPLLSLHSPRLLPVSSVSGFASSRHFLYIDSCDMRAFVSGSFHGARFQVHPGPPYCQVCGTSVPRFITRSLGHRRLRGFRLLLVGKCCCKRSCTRACGDAVRAGGAREQETGSGGSS